jgi:prepilin-type N-terminal cleavage/methylation domain-containing protein
MKGWIMKVMKKSSAGFTLIEIIVSLVLMSIVGVVAAMALVQGIEAYVITRTSSETVQRAEYALNRIKLEFMNMDTVTAAGADTITFTSDKTNGRTQGTVYTFTHTGTQINLTVTPLAGAASTNALITGLGTYGTGLFTYRNNAGGAWVQTDGFGRTGSTPSTCPSTSYCCSGSLNSITINLIIARSDGGGNLTFATSVNPRNNECTDGPEATAGSQ